jgi:hypothetical protein
MVEPAIVISRTATEVIMHFAARRWIACAAVALGTPLGAIGSDLGYTYAELRYLGIERDEGADADGGTAIGWYRLSESVFAIGQLIMTEADNDAEANTVAAGAGYIHSLNDQWDAVAIGTFRRTEIDAARDTEKNGYGAQLGLRGMPIPKLETRVFVNYVDVIDDDTSLFMSGDYWFSPQLAAGVAAELGGDADVFSIGLRYSFGN